MDKTTQDNIDRICNYEQRLAKVRRDEKRKSRRWTKTGKFYNTIKIYK